MPFVQRVYPRMLLLRFPMSDRRSRRPWNRMAQPRTLPVEEFDAVSMKVGPKAVPLPEEILGLLSIPARQEPESLGIISRGSPSATAGIPSRKPCTRAFRSPAGRTRPSAVPVPATRRSSHRQKDPGLPPHPLLLVTPRFGTALSSAMRVPLRTPGVGLRSWREVRGVPLQGLLLVVRPLRARAGPSASGPDRPSLAI